ncbi:MAG TPA: chemotaxis protein CheB, partial [Flavitalea sp.]|nr:chemotaxis protein CheB [Flavitalea sp.]
MKNGFEIIVVGGSAGSLEPLLTILEALKPSRFAIVLILHRKASNDSVLATVLSRRSAYPVKEAGNFAGIQDLIHLRFIDG